MSARARAIVDGSFLDTAWSVLQAIELGRMNDDTKEYGPAPMSLATQMAWLWLVDMLDIVAVHSRAGVDDYSGPWADFPTRFDVPEAEARAHVETLVRFDMLRETVDGGLMLPDDLRLTPQHGKSRITGWRQFVPAVVQGGRL